MNTTGTTSRLRIGLLTSTALTAFVLATPQQAAAVDLLSQIDITQSTPINLNADFPGNPDIDGDGKITAVYDEGFTLDFSGFNTLTPLPIDLGIFDGAFAIRGSGTEAGLPIEVENRGTIISDFWGVQIRSDTADINVLNTETGVIEAGTGQFGAGSTPLAVNIAGNGTFENRGSITGGVFLADLFQTLNTVTGLNEYIQSEGTLLNTSTGTIDGRFLLRGTGSITNDGRVNELLYASGLLTSTLDNRTYSPDSNISVTNTGTANAVFSTAATVSITNSGTLTGASNSTDAATGETFATIRVLETDVETSVTIVNETDGTIDGGEIGEAIGFVRQFNLATGQSFVENPIDPKITVTNRGTINGDVEASTLINEGTITADEVTTGYYDRDDILPSITNSGTITVEFVETDLFDNSGTLNLVNQEPGIDTETFEVDSLVNSGVITSNNGVLFFEEEDTSINALTLQTGSDLQVDVDANVGVDSLTLEGTGTEDNNLLNFETLTMRGEDWTISSDLTVESTTLESGILRTNGIFTTQSLSFGAGGGLGGTGTYMGSVSSAGTISPGDMGAVGTFTIDGDFTSQAGSTLAVDITPEGNGDLLAVTGTATLNGGSVAVTGVDGDYAVSTDYEVLTADGGVSGEFDDVDVNLTFLTPSLSYTANGVVLNVERKSGEIQEEVIEQTTSQQISTSSRTISQAVTVRVDSIISGGPAPGGGVGGTSTDVSSRGDGPLTGISAGDSSSGWSAWASITPTFFDQSAVLTGQTLGQAFEGTTWNLFAGADKVIGSNGVIGGFVSYENTDIDLITIDGTRGSDGFMLGTYAGVVFTDWLYASSTLTYAFMNNDISESAFGSTPVTGKFDSERFAFNTSVTAYRQFNQIRASGKVAYSYTRESFDEYTTSDGSDVDLDSSRLGRLSIGGELAYMGESFTPYINATFERDVQAGGFGEEEGMILGAGARIAFDRLTVDLFGSAETGRAGESSETIGLNFRYTF